MKVSFCKLSFCMVTRVCDYYVKFFFIVVSFMFKLLLRLYLFNMFDKSFGDWFIEICVKIIDVGGFWFCFVVIYRKWFFFVLFDLIIDFL